MRYAEATRPVCEHTLQTHLYEMVETLQDVQGRVRSCISLFTGPAALVTIMLHFEYEGKGPANRLAQIEQSTLYFLQNLRPLVRKTDAVFLLNHTLYFLLFGANAQGGRIVKERLWDALLWRIHNSSEREILRPSSIAWGLSAYPRPITNSEELVEAASSEQLHFDLHTEKATRKAALRSRSGQDQKQEQAKEEPVTEELPALARKLGVPYLSLLPRKPPQRVQQLVNAQLAQELHCYPIGRERNMLTVAMLDPRDRSVLDRLQQETGLCIFPVLTNPSELQTALEQLI